MIEPYHCDVMYNVIAKIDILIIQHIWAFVLTPYSDIELQST